MSKQKPATMIIIFMYMFFLKYNVLEYQERYGENVNGMRKHTAAKCTSLQFSVVASIVAVLVSLLDFAMVKKPGTELWGFGSSGYLWMWVPFTILFSVNKKTKRKSFNLTVPIYYICHFVILMGCVSYMISYIYCL